MLVINQGNLDPQLISSRHQTQHITLTSDQPTALNMSSPRFPCRHLGPSARLHSICNELCSRITRHRFPDAQPRRHSRRRFRTLATSCEPKLCVQALRRYWKGKLSVIFLGCRRTNADSKNISDFKWRSSREKKQ